MRLYLEATDDLYVERYVESVSVSVSSAQSLGSGSSYGSLLVDATPRLLNISDNDLFVLNTVNVYKNIKRHNKYGLKLERKSNTKKNKRCLWFSV